MDIDNLVTMANQIASFYETMPDHKKTLEDISTHFKKFWDPRMRRELLNYVDSINDSNKDTELKPIVLESIQLYRPLLSR